MSPLPKIGQGLFKKGYNTETRRMIRLHDECEPTRMVSVGGNFNHPIEVVNQFSHVLLFHSMQKQEIDNFMFTHSG